MDSRKVDLRQRRNRQEKVTKKPEHDDPGHQERRGDWSPNKGFRNIHNSIRGPLISSTIILGNIGTSFVVLILALICHRRWGASSWLLGSLRMPAMVPGSVLSGRLFDGRILILSGRFVSLGQLLLSARLIRGCNLNGRTGLEFILTVNDDLIPFLKAAINQRQSAVNLCDPHRAHFGRFILGNHVGISSVRSALYYSCRND